MILKNKHIILGVTGSIAAYKAAILVRSLVKEGAEVKVIMTDLAKAFITPLTLATLSKNPVLVEFYNPENGDWNNHVDLGLWADAMLIAPATANTMAKMANGIADNLLLTSYLSARCPVFIAPAMDLDMFRHPATTKNISILKDRGDIVIEPATGELASGLEGKGRMEEPEKIIQTLQHHFAVKSSEEKKNSLNRLKGKKVLITAGPTRESIDPVRYLSNHSSGKMGYALAKNLVSAGAEVFLISGPVELIPPDRLAKLVRVTSAEEMLKACEKEFKDSDIAILAAAVADYKATQPESQKIKSTQSELSITLSRTTDIAELLGKQKKPDQIIVGFALETENETENALQKLYKKNFDFIVLNSLNDKGAGFGYDTNQVTIIDRNNKMVKFGLKEKSEVAIDILGVLAEKLLPNETE